LYIKSDLEYKEQFNFLRILIVSFEIKLEVFFAIETGGVIS